MKALIQGDSTDWSWEGPSDTHRGSLRGLENQKDFDIQKSLGNEFLPDGAAVIKTQCQDQAWSL